MTFPCESIVPSIGFALGAEQGGFEQEWSIEPSVLSKNLKDGKCTIDLIGWDLIQDGTWWLGQAWLKGKYVDFSGNQVTVGSLKTE